jgi:K+-transporting ATPase KdpF subunit
MESPSNSNILHDFYGGIGNICAVFPNVGLICNHGSGLSHRPCLAFVADTRIGRRMRGVGTQKVTWAYGLSGLVSLALLVYLVAALIRAEDL